MSAWGGGEKRGEGELTEGQLFDKTDHGQPANDICLRARVSRGLFLVPDEKVRQAVTGELTVQESSSRILVDIKFFCQGGGTKHDVHKRLIEGTESATHYFAGMILDRSRRRCDTVIWALKMPISR